MWTILWLAVTSFIGFELLIHSTADLNPLIGAAAGFGVGGTIRILIAMGGDGVGEILEAVGEILSGCFD